MNSEIIKKHDIYLPDDYIPNPTGHLHNDRDSYHFHKTELFLKNNSVQTVLDIGCWDGWLDFLLIEKGYRVTGLEMIENLAKAAMRYANRLRLDYQVFLSSIEYFQPSSSFDAVIAYEILEHIDLTIVPSCIEKIEKLSTKLVLISLPDQDKELNVQHAWTPTMKIIEGLFGKKSNMVIEYKEYPGTTIPGNWLIKYEVTH